MLSLWMMITLRSAIWDFSVCCSYYGSCQWTRDEYHVGLCVFPVYFLTVESIHECA